MSLAACLLQHSFYSPSVSRTDCALSARESVFLRKRDEKEKKPRYTTSVFVGRI
mgnify:CR=1 FL=1